MQYTCGFSHLFFSLILAPVENVILTQEITNHISSDFTSASHLTFVQNSPQSLQCVAVGGNPPPAVNVIIGKRHYTDHFSTKILPKITGKKGFRLMHSTTVLWSRDFIVSSHEDNRKLKCIATVAGLAPEVTSARIQVNCTSKQETLFATYRVDIYY